MRPKRRALRDPFFLFLWKLIPIPLRLYWKRRRTRETSSTPLSPTHTYTRFFFSASHFYDLKFNIGSLQILLLYDQGDCAWNLTCTPCGDVICKLTHALFQPASSLSYNMFNMRLPVMFDQHYLSQIMRTLWGNAFCCHLTEQKIFCKKGRTFKRWL